MKKELKIGIFAAVAFIIFGYFVIKTDSLVGLLSRGKTYPVYAKFSNVSGLFNNAPVRLAGVQIGIVEKIFLEQDKAVVKMLIKNKYTLTSDARASITSVGIVGENFIEIFYRDKYKSSHPQFILPEGHIKTVRKFGLEEVGDAIENITPKIKTTLDSLNRLLADENSQSSIKATLEKKKDQLTRTKLNYYAGLDYLTGEKNARFAFGMDLNFTGFTLFTRVREDALAGGTDFTVMAGKRFKYFSVGAGMVDSNLGAALYLNLFNRRLNVQLEASRFYKERNWDRDPMFKAIVSFSLNKNISLSAGYEDFLEKAARKFLVGVAFKN